MAGEGGGRVVRTLIQPSQLCTTSHGIDWDPLQSAIQSIKRFRSDLGPSHKFEQNRDEMG